MAQRRKGIYVKCVGIQFYLRVISYCLMPVSLIQFRAKWGPRQIGFGDVPRTEETQRLESEGWEVHKGQKMTMSRF